MNGVNQCLNTLVMLFFKEGIQKLIPGYQKCIVLNEDYVEK